MDVGEKRGQIHLALLYCPFEIGVFGQQHMARLIEIGVPGLGIKGGRGRSRGREYCRGNSQQNLNRRSHGLAPEDAMPKIWHWPQALSIAHELRP
jgi:hypothetical protein